MNRIGPLLGIVRSLAFLLALFHPGVPAMAQSPEAPPDYGPVSINLEDVPYPYPVQYLPLSIDGLDLRLAYMDVKPQEDVANGRTVVLLHGLNFFGEYWGDTMEALRQAGFRTIAIDQIGFGRSSKPIMPYTLGDMALNIRALLEHLGIETAAIVGHSMGGMVATRFAFHFPDIASHLVVVNPIGLTDARIQRPPERLEDMYESALRRDYRAIRANFERYYATWDPAAEKYVRIHYGWTLSPDWPRMARIRALLSRMIYAEPVVYDWPHIRVRTLVIGGTEDGPNFPELARQVAATIPEARLHLIPGVGHNPHLEAPDAFRPVLIDFLRTEPLAR